MRAGAIALAAAVLAAAPACSSGPAPAPATVAAQGPTAAGERAAEVAAEPTDTAAATGSAGATDEADTRTAADAPDAGTTSAEPTPADDPTVVTIEPAGGRAAEPKTLAEAAEAARARRGDRPKATTVITNENLGEWAARAKVTLAPDPSGESGTAGPAGAEPSSGGVAAGAGAADRTAADAGAAGSGTAAAATPADPAAAAAGSSPPSGAVEPADPSAGPRDEAYWRERARELRTRWAAAAEEIERLEKEAADLRWAFYAEDDPYYRDERIKPVWDRALDDLRRARQDERYFREQVEELMEDGRRAGALPGWLREGIELEPEDPGDSDAPIGREPRSTEPIEPPTTGEGRPR